MRSFILVLPVSLDGKRASDKINNLFSSALGVVGIQF